VNSATSRRNTAPSAAVPPGAGKLRRERLDDDPGSRLLEFLRMRADELLGRFGGFPVIETVVELGLWQDKNHQLFMDVYS